MPVEGTNHDRIRIESENRGNNTRGEAANGRACLAVQLSDRGQQAVYRLGFEDTWEFIIYLNEPIPVNIDSNEIADYAGYKQNYILGFQSLRGSAVDEINDEYGSIEGYINANRTDGNHIQTSGGSQDPDEGDDSVVDEVLDEADRDEEAYANIARQLEEVGQVVFYGPPGTGKTYNAQQFARWWLHNLQSEPRESQVRSYFVGMAGITYEDFLEGLTANATENSVSYDIKPGKFKAICEDARVDIVKERLETARNESLQSTQVKRVLDQIDDWTDDSTRYSKEEDKRGMATQTWDTYGMRSTEKNRTGVVRLSKGEGCYTALTHALRIYRLST